MLLSALVGLRCYPKSYPRSVQHVGIGDISVRYSERVDFRRPVEAVIPGAAGRLLASLAQVEAELPVSTLARISGVGRTRASVIVADLARLGIVDRRQVGRTVLVSLDRQNAAGQLVDRLAHLGSEVIAKLRSMAAELDPAPETVLLYGSFARGDAGADSDLDVLAVRSPNADPDKWSESLSVFASQARSLTGNRVQVLEYDLDDLRRKAGPRAKVGRAFWDAVRRDAIVLAGSSLDDVVGHRP
jgi:predicted nucleotidyltransferase